MIVRSAEGHRAPLTLRFLAIGKTEDIEAAATPCAATEQQVAIRQFLTFRLVATRYGRGIRTAQERPGSAKVVAVEHPVGRLAGIDGRACAV